MDMIPHSTLPSMLIPNFDIATITYQYGYQIKGLGGPLVCYTLVNKEEPTM